MKEERLYDVYALNNEDIKILETQILDCKECKFATCKHCKISWKEVKAIERLIERVKELEEINKTSPEKIKVIADSFHEKMANKFDEDFILKSKVKEKIEEFKKEMEEDEVDEFGIHSVGWGCLSYMAEFLQELLEEE